MLGIVALHRREQRLLLDCGVRTEQVEQHKAGRRGGCVISTPCRLPCRPHVAQNSVVLSGQLRYGTDRLTSAVLAHASTLDRDDRPRAEAKVPRHHRRPAAAHPACSLDKTDRPGASVTVSSR